MKKIFIIQLFIVICLIFLPLLASAIEYPIGGLNGDNIHPGQYIRALFIWGLGIIGAMAVAGMALGGFFYMVGKIDQGKDYIYSSLLGLLLLFGAWLILYTINPDLVNLRGPTLEKINLEPPGPPDTGQTGPCSGGLCFKDAYMQNDLATLKPALQNTLSNTPVPLTLTETTHNHGCFSGDPCAGNASCGTSLHCTGQAVDIRVSNLNQDQITQTLQYLDSQPCVQQVYYGGSGATQYCVTNGQKESSPSQSCLGHTDHIHYAVKSGC